MPDARGGRADAAAAGHGPFEVVLAGAGAFPSGTRPRALWIGHRAGRRGAGRARGRPRIPPLEPLGWPPTPRPFRPHLTVARRTRVHRRRAGRPSRTRWRGRAAAGARRSGPSGRASTGATSAAGPAALRAARSRSSSPAERAGANVDLRNVVAGATVGRARLRAPTARRALGGRLDGQRPSPPDQVRARRGPDPAGLVQHRGRPAGPAAARPSTRAPTSRIGPADLAPAVPDGADPPGGQRRARDRDPGPGPRGVPAVPALAAAPGAPAREGARHPGPHLLQVRGREPGRQPQAEHGDRRRPSSTRRRASRASRPRPAPASGGARWRSRARCSGSRSRSTWSGRATTRSRTAGS